MKDLMNKLIAKNQQVMLCRGKACCPVGKKTKEGKVQITDDDGNKLVLTNEQALMIPEALEVLDKDG